MVSYTVKSYPHPVIKFPPPAISTASAPHLLPPVHEWIVTPTNLSRRYPCLCIGNNLSPIGLQHNRSLQNSHKQQRERNARPQPEQFPAEYECGCCREGHGNDVIGYDVDVRAEMLSSYPATVSPCEQEEMKEKG